MRPSHHPGSRHYLRVGDYEVLRHLATGGMSAIYLAQHTRTGREVALKVLSPEFAAQPARVERFQREARNAARLRHDHIVGLVECGEDNGIHFLALDFVDGINLLDHIREHGVLDPEEARLILLGAARALRHAHEQGVTHRDVKPSNLLLPGGDPAAVQLTDFGLSRGPEDGASRVTAHGCTVGTVDYMAPEQARDSRLADVRSDLYSLGCTVYHALTGQPPYPDGTTVERVLAHREAEVPDVRRMHPAVPPDLAAVLRRLLAKRPEARCQNAGELLDALAFLDGAFAPVGPEEAANPLGLPMAQLRTAAGQFECARTMIIAGQWMEAVDLLVGCCGLDPANLRYQRALRRVLRSLGGAPPTGFWGRLRRWAARRAVRKSVRGDPLQALRVGGAKLREFPEDPVLLEALARAAQDLGLAPLATWFLQTADESRPPTALPEGVPTPLARILRDYNEVPSAETRRHDSR